MSEKEAKQLSGKWILHAVGKMCISADPTLSVLQLVIEFPLNVTEPGTGLHIYFSLEPLRFLVILLLLI